MNGTASWVKVAIAIVPALVYLIAIANQISTTASAVQSHAMQTITQSTIDTALLRAICRHGSRNAIELNFCDSVGLPSP